jgi:hypothetical protein
MELSYLDASFDALDTLSVETLALFMLSDKRPLRGGAGVVDWRLCGELSRSLQSGGLTGKVGERLLMPTHGRIGARRLLVFGAGASDVPLGALELGRCLAVAHKAGASDLAVELPENAKPDAVAEALQQFPGKRLLLVGTGEAVKARLSSGERASSRA